MFVGIIHIKHGQILYIDLGGVNPDGGLSSPRWGGGLRSYLILSIDVNNYTTQLF